MIVAPDLAEIGTYSIAVVPGLPQIRCATYQQAVSKATAWVSEKGVTAWHTGDGKHLAVLKLP